MQKSFYSQDLGHLERSMYIGILECCVASSADLTHEDYKLGAKPCCHMYVSKNPDMREKHLLQQKF
jgi:hypothetical protein